jgi:hypothetical protein
LTIVVVPAATDVDRSVQVVADGGVPLLRIRHSVVGEDPLVLGSRRSNDPVAWAPLCDTVNVRPAIVRVPVLAAPGLSVTEMNTLPLPVPLAPLRIVMNDALDVAVHAQPLGAVTVIVDVALVLLMLRLDGEIAYEQVLWVRNVSVAE